MSMNWRSWPLDISHETYSWQSSNYKCGISQGSVATLWRCGGNLYYTLLWKFHHLSNSGKFWKFIWICQRYCQNSTPPFWDTVYIMGLNSAIGQFTLLHLLLFWYRTWNDILSAELYIAHRKTLCRAICKCWYFCLIFLYWIILFRYIFLPVLLLLCDDEYSWIFTNHADAIH